MKKSSCNRIHDGGHMHALSQIKQMRLPKPLIIAAALVLGLALLYAADLNHHGRTVNSEGDTAYCMSCHAGPQGGPQKIIPYRSHKVMVVYPPPGRGQAFRPLQEVLAHGIRFEKGMVTCISCHDLHNEERNHLAIETNTGGFAQKLCYVCHLDIG